MNRIHLFSKVPFDQVDTQTLLGLIETWCLHHQKKLVLNMNAHGVVTYLNQPRYAYVINSADLIYPDGWGPVLASRLETQPLKERVNVGDFMPELLSRLNQHHLSIYLLGTTQTTLTQAHTVLKNQYPHLKVAGTHHGFFSPQEEKQVIKSLNQQKPRLVLVGMGIPKQEIWLQKNWSALPSAVYMGVGGAFHYLAGTKSRAPVWMRRSGFEWLYRLGQEPLRLGPRYTIGNIKFLYYLIKTGIKKIL